MTSQMVTTTDVHAASGARTKVALSHAGAGMRPSGAGSWRGLVLGTPRGSPGQDNGVPTGGYGEVKWVNVEDDVAPATLATFSQMRSAAR
jgi:hypothetical protein